MGTGAIFNPPNFWLRQKNFEGEASSLTLPSKEEELTIPKNHIPPISPLKKGRVLVRVGEKESIFQIDSGLLEVKPDSVVVLVEF